MPDKAKQIGSSPETIQSTVIQGHTGLSPLGQGMAGQSSWSQSSGGSQTSGGQWMKQPQTQRTKITFQGNSQQNQLNKPQTMQFFHPQV